jgi:hypothetical protein
VGYPHTAEDDEGTTLPKKVVPSVTRAPSAAEYLVENPARRRDEP